MPVLGMIEFASIAVGIHATDAMVKAAPIDIVETHPIDPGRYATLVTGGVASVESAVEAGVRTAGEGEVIQSFVLANLHSQVLPAIRGNVAAAGREAVGVIETSCSAAIVLAADAACKTADVRLIKLRLALHLGGKGYSTFAGTIADVEAALEAAVRAAGCHAQRYRVLPNPYPEFSNYLSAPDDPR